MNYSQSYQYFQPNNFLLYSKTNESEYKTNNSIEVVFRFFGESKTQADREGTKDKQPVILTFLNESITENNMKSAIGKPVNIDHTKKVIGKILEVFKNNNGYTTKKTKTYIKPDGEWYGIAEIESEYYNKYSGTSSEFFANTKSMKKTNGITEKKIDHFIIDGVALTNNPVINDCMYLIKNSEEENNLKKNLTNINQVKQPKDNMFNMNENNDKKEEIKEEEKISCSEDLLSDKIKNSIKDFIKESFFEVIENSVEEKIKNSYEKLEKSCFEVIENSFKKQKNSLMEDDEVKNAFSEHIKKDLESPSVTNSNFDEEKETVKNAFSELKTQVSEIKEFLVNLKNSHTKNTLELDSSKVLNSHIGRSVEDEREDLIASCINKVSSYNVKF